MSLHARCFLCGSRITSHDLRSEQVNGNVVERRYECELCSAEHTIRGYVPHAASTSVGPGVLMISRRQAAADMDDLASAVANACGVPVPMNFLADLSQALDFWADGDLQGPWLEEFQRIRQLNAR